MEETTRRVSVIAAMLDEADHVEGVVADLAAQDFQGEIELLVADGGSTDGSPLRLAAAAERLGVQLVLLENEAGWVSHGLNACIRAAEGDLLVRIDCHSRYPSDYVRRCVEAADETGALVVGGVIAGRGRTRTERSVACAMDSPFGGIGFYRVVGGDAARGVLARLGGLFGLARDANARTDGRIDTDTLTFGAFRPEAFRRAGLFDESLRRNQDDELNLRIRRAGGRVVLDPRIQVHYTPRGSLRGVYRQYFEYGFWKVAVMAKHREPPGPRALVPAAFVGSVGALALLAPWSRPARMFLAAELGLYASAALVAAAASARSRSEPAELVPRVAAVFPAFHVGYGIGMLSGLTRAAARAFGRVRRGS